MSSEMIPMEVIGVRVEMPSNQPIILLREIDGTRFLPIWVGAVEATAIAFAQLNYLKSSMRVW
jgi:bifunctional DNase/RNase